MLYKIIGNIDPIRRLLALQAGLMVLAIVYFAADVREQLNTLATAYSDNVQWTLSQAEVEAKSLETEVAIQSMADAPDLASVRTRFDILYSRYATLRESPLYASLRSDPRVESAIIELGRFFDDTIPVIDGPDQALREFLPDLIVASSDAHGQLRQIAITGIEIFSRLSDDRRVSVSQTLFEIAVLSALLFLALTLLIFLLLSILKRMDTTTQSLRETKDRMQTIVDNSLDAIVVTDLDGRIVEFNRAAENIFGYPRDAVLGRPMGELIVPDYLRDLHETGMKRYLAGGERHVIGKGIVQLDALRANGDIFPVDIALAAAASSDDRLIIGFMRDISKRRQAETELLEARDKAIAGEKSKAELLAVMSHEMRTPLNGMLGTLELIEDETLDDETRRYLGIVRKSGETLLGHVNDVLEISRLDSNKMKIDARPFDLVALMREIIDSQEGTARENGNDLKLTPPDPALHQVWSDEGRVRQILFNLVGNALKFTVNGTVTLEAECHYGLEEIEIRVIDTGIGIEEEDIARVFEDFVTIDASYGRSSGGTGLGLGISQRLARALGGDLGAESEPGEGSVFWLRLPLSPASGALPPDTDTIGSPPQEVQPDAPALPALKVLLVEDNATNRLVAREMLERDGHSVTEAHNGREGVDAARSARYDLILMDISMPGLDGVEATAEIRADPDIDSSLPIIATTAHALPDEIRRFRNAGMTDILVKPLRRAELRNALSAAITGQQVSLATHGPATNAATVPDLLDDEQIDALNSTLPPEKLSALIAEFNTEMAAFQRALAGSPANGVSLDALADEAHRMAGSAAVFGARRLNHLLRRIETTARNRTALDPNCPELFTCWQETSALLCADQIASRTKQTLP